LKKTLEIHGVSHRFDAKQLITFMEQLSDKKSFPYKLLSEINRIAANIFKSMFE